MAPLRGGTSSGATSINPGTPGRRVPEVAATPSTAASAATGAAGVTEAGLSGAASPESRLSMTATAEMIAATASNNTMPPTRLGDHDRKSTSSSDESSARGSSNGAAAGSAGLLALSSCAGSLGNSVQVGEGGGRVEEGAASGPAGAAASEGASADSGAPSDVNVALRRPLLAGAFAGGNDDGRFSEAGRASALSSVENGERCGALREAGRDDGGSVARTEGGGVSERAGPSGASVEERRELGTEAAGNVELRVGTGRWLGNEPTFEPSFAGARGPDDGINKAESTDSSGPGCTDSSARRSTERCGAPKNVAISAWLATRSRATMAIAVASSAQSAKR